MTRRSPIVPRALVALLALVVTGTAGVVCTAGSAGADTVLTLKTHTDAFSLGAIQEAAKDRETRIWIGDQRLRRDEGTDMSYLLRIDQNKLYLVDHRSKSYNALDLPIDFHKLYPQGDEGEKMMQQASAMSKMDVTIKPSEEAKKVGDWNAKRYDVQLTNAMGMKVETTMWMSTDVGVDLATLNKMVTALAALRPGTMDWMKKMEELPGFPVRQESTVTAMDVPVKSVQELVNVEKKEAPAGLYDPPAGYELRKFDPAQVGL